MRVMIIGSNGLLGTALVKCMQCDGGVDVITVARSGADYCFDLLEIESLNECLKTVKPDIVINCAALVSFELCKEKYTEAYAINGRLPGILAEICDSIGAYFIHISTDHYYTGDGRKKHKESEPVKLINEYSRTKFIGEQLVQLFSNTIVIRTNFVGFKRTSFLGWCIGALREDKKITLFEDFYTSTLFVGELCEIIKKMIILRPTGLYNIASSSVSSKAEFIIALSEKIFCKKPNYDLGKVNTGNLSVCRGNSLGLDVGAIESVLNLKMPFLDEVIFDIKKELDVWGWI